MYSVSIALRKGIGFDESPFYAGALCFDWIDAVFQFMGLDFCACWNLDCFRGRNDSLEYFKRKIKKTYSNFYKPQKLAKLLGFIVKVVRIRFFLEKKAKNYNYGKKFFSKVRSSC